MKAVILARGLGSRMRKVDDDVSLSGDQAAAADKGHKALMPLAGRPFLDFVLSGLADAGVREVCLVVAPAHEEIRARYVDATHSRLTITTAIQAEPRGTADAVLAAESFAAGKPFLVINADNYYPTDVLARLLDQRPPALPAFSREGLIAEGAIPAERIMSYALLDIGPDGCLRRIVEKPSAADAAALGDARVSMNCWLFGPEIFDACRHVKPSPRGELELQSAVQSLIDAGVCCHTFAVDASVLDLSRRTDIPLVTGRLSGITVSL
jgi:glucose-1-phosphate thymidylyltransferase